jgi:heme exporter protein B
MAILAKDLRIEIRTREIVTTAGFFAALIAVLASVAFNLDVDDAMLARLAPGALWLAVAFASVLALGRTWQREREEGALTGLLVSPIPRASILVGKALGVAAFIAVIEIVVLPLIMLFFHVEAVAVTPALLPVLFLATVGVAMTGTLFGAMTVRTRARDLVLAAVLFPLLSPTLISAVAATREVFFSVSQAIQTGTPIPSLGSMLAMERDYLLLLGVFDAVSIAGSMAIFGALLED